MAQQTIPTEEALVEALRNIRLTNPALGRSKILEKLRNGGFQISETRLKKTMNTHNLQTRLPDVVIEPNTSTPSYDQREQSTKPEERAPGNDDSPTIPNELFTPFPRLPKSIQRRIWNHALPPGPTIIEVLYCDSTSQIRVSEDPSQFLCSGSCVSILTVVGQLKDPKLNVLPVHIPKIVKEGSGATPRVETVYLRPNVDILYLPEIHMTGGLDFVKNKDNQRAVTALAVNATTIEMLTMTRAMGQYIRHFKNLKTVYAVEGAKLGDEWGQVDRGVNWDIRFVNVRRGEYVGGQGERQVRRFNTGYVDVIEEVWRRTIAADMVVNGRRKQPELVCRQVKRTREVELAQEWERLREQGFTLGSHAVNPPREVIINGMRATRIEIPLEY